MPKKDPDSSLWVEATPGDLLLVPWNDLWLPDSASEADHVSHGQNSSRGDDIGYTYRVRAKGLLGYMEFLTLAHVCS